MEISSNQRKASAPPALNIRNNNSGIPTNKKSHADTVRTHINDDIYQERVNRLAAKTDKLINSHRKAQQVNSGNTPKGSPIFNHRSVSLGSMGSNSNGNSNGMGSGSNPSSREKTPSIVEIPPSPVIKKPLDNFGFNAEPLTVSSDNGKSNLFLKIKLVNYVLEAHTVKY